MATKQYNFGPIITAGTLMGVGLGGFVDGIIFHQILQTHNMISGYMPVTDLISAKTNMTWDGIFHAAVWLISTIGLMMLLNAGKRRDVPWSVTVFKGAWLFGWGLFNLIEGIIDHNILVVHHVLEYYPRKEQLIADYAFLASGILFIVLGRIIINKGKKRWLEDPTAPAGAGLLRP